MSSLLQHRGAIKNGKVEILMYLQIEVETPMRCMWCATPYTEGHVCRGKKCGRAITHIFRYNDPSKGPTAKDKSPGASDETIELFREWPEELVSFSQCGANRTCYCANSWSRKDAEPVTLTRPDGTTTTVPKLYRIWRAPKGMLGCWVVFVWEGKEHVPDLSVPTGVYKLPRDAQALTDEEAAAYWFKS